MSELPETDPSVEASEAQISMAQIPVDAPPDSQETPGDENRQPEHSAEDGMPTNAAFDFAQDQPAPITEDEPEPTPAPQSAEAVREDETETAQAEPVPPEATTPTAAEEPESGIPTGAIAQALETALKTATEASNLEAYRSFIQAYQKESGHDIDTIAAALAAAIGNSQRKKPRPQSNNKTQTANEHHVPEEGMAQYRIEVGRSDGVQPRNIVGALTNEAELGASDIGYIKIFDRFSLVELPDSIPQEELEHLAEVWVCGRKMGIRPDDGPPENESGKSHPPRRDKRSQGRGGPSRNDRDRGARHQASRDGGDRNGGNRNGQGGAHRGRFQGGGRNRDDGERQNPRGANPKDDNFGNRIDYTPKDRGRLHNIIYGDGIANVGQENGPGGNPLGLGKGRRNGGGGAKGNNRGSGFNGRDRSGPSRRRRQD